MLVSSAKNGNVRSSFDQHRTADAGVWVGGDPIGWWRGGTATHTAGATLPNSFARGQLATTKRNVATIQVGLTFELAVAMTMKSKLLFSLLVPTLMASSACGLVKVKGLGTSSTPSSTPSSSSPAAKANAPAGKVIDGAPADDGLAQKISYDRFLSTGSYSGDYAFRIFKADAVHPERGGNPDPKWILEWRQPLNQEDAKTIIAQAAINRTWLAKAELDFATWWGKLEPLYNAQRDAIAGIEASKDNHYGKIQALLALWSKTKASATAAGLGTNYALQFQVAQAAERIVKAADAGFATYELLIAIGADTAFAKNAQVFSSKEDAFAQFVLRAQNWEMERTTDRTKAAVRWPLAAEQEKAVVAAREKTTAAATAMYAKHADWADVDAAQEPTADVWIGGGEADNVGNGKTVKKVSAVSATGFTLTGSDNKMEPYNCKGGVVQNLDGSLERGQNCQYRQNNTKLVVVVKAADVPVKLQVGDAVSMVGARTKRTATAKTVTAEVTARYIYKVERNGKVVAGF
jgi:hypothetical protein